MLTATYRFLIGFPQVALWHTSTLQQSLHFACHLQSIYFQLSLSCSTLRTYSLNTSLLLSHWLIPSSIALNHRVVFLDPPLRLSIFCRPPPPFETPAHPPLLNIWPTPKAEGWEDLLKLVIAIPKFHNLTIWLGWVNSTFWGGNHTTLTQLNLYQHKKIGQTWHGGHHHRQCHRVSGRMSMHRPSAWDKVRTIQS